MEMQQYHFQDPSPRPQPAPPAVRQQRVSRPSLVKGLPPVNAAPLTPKREVLLLPNIAPPQPSLGEGALPHQHDRLPKLAKGKQPLVPLHGNAAAFQFIVPSHHHQPDPLPPATTPRPPPGAAAAVLRKKPTAGRMLLPPLPIEEPLPLLVGNRVSAAAPVAVSPPSDGAGVVCVSNEAIISEIVVPFAPTAAAAPEGPAALPHGGEGRQSQQQHYHPPQEEVSPSRATPHTIERRRKQAMMFRMLSNDEAQKQNAELMNRYRLISSDVNEIERRQMELRRHTRAIRSSTEHSAARHRHTVEQLQAGLDNTTKLSAERESIQNLYKGKLLPPVNSQHTKAPHSTAGEEEDEDHVRHDGDSYEKETAAEAEEEEGGDLASSSQQPTNETASQHTTTSFLPPVVRKGLKAPSPGDAKNNNNHNPNHSAAPIKIEDIMHNISAFYQAERVALLRSGGAGLGMRHSTATTIDAEARRYQLKAEADAKRAAKAAEESAKQQRAQEEALFQARKLMFRSVEQERRREEAKQRERMLREEAILDSKSKIEEKSRRVDDWKFRQQHKSPLPLTKMVRAEDF